MKKTIVNQPNLRISCKTGTEGPEYDPYGYQETTIERGNWTLTYHGGGLMEWLCIKNSRSKKTRMKELRKRDITYIDKQFAKHTGFTLREWQKFTERLEQRKFRIHRHHNVTSEQGYPGESFLYCRDCGQVIDYSFDISAVI